MNGNNLYMHYFSVLFCSGAQKMVRLFKNVPLLCVNNNLVAV